MMFVLRWPIVLVLMALVMGSLVPALIGTIETYDLPVDLSFMGGAQDTLREFGKSTTLIERVLWYAAAVFFFIAAVRLVRRTQGFWLWLLGFAAYGARWGLAQQEQGGLIATVQSVEMQSFTPSGLATGGSSAQMTFLVFLLVVGLLIFVIDHFDRAYWDRHGG